jgi:tectonin-like protein
MRTNSAARWLAAVVCCLAASAWGQLGWKQMPGAGNDIGVGPTGQAWVIGTDQSGNDYGIYRLDGANWTKVPGGAVRIDVGPNGPWVVNSGGGIYSWNGTNWTLMPGGAKDVGIGANGTVWVIGVDKPSPNDYGIYRWNTGSKNWDKMPGWAVRIDVDPQGNAWVVNSTNNIFKWNGSGWQQMPGAALDVGIGSEGTVYIVGTDQGVYKWNGSNWDKKDGALTNISVDNKGNPWGVNSAKAIFAATTSGGSTPTPAASGPAMAGAALSSAELNTVMKWIAARVATARQDYCYRSSYGRGVGTIPDDCQSKEKDAGLCYNRCNAGYGAAGPVCWQYCPSGYVDTGAFCHIDKALMVSPTWGWVSKWWGGYPTTSCPSGYTNIGALCALNTPSNPPGWKGTGLDLIKSSYGRGVGTVPNCSGNKQNDAGLCYTPCNNPYYGVGPVCWQSCPSGKTNCGAGCASSTAQCVSSTVDMIKAPAELVFNVVTMGSGNAATKAEKVTKFQKAKEALEAAAKIADVALAAKAVGETTTVWLNDYLGSFSDVTTPEVAAEINKRFSPKAATWVKTQYAYQNLSLMAAADGFKTAQTTLTVVGLMDPIGVVGVAEAFTQPICNVQDPFPAVSPKY